MCASEVNFPLVPTHHALVHITECFGSVQTGFLSDKNKLQDVLQEHIYHVPAAKVCSVCGARSGEPLQDAQRGAKFSALTFVFFACPVPAALHCCPSDRAQSSLERVCSQPSTGFTNLAHCHHCSLCTWRKCGWHNAFTIGIFIGT